VSVIEEELTISVILSVLCAIVGVYCVLNCWHVTELLIFGLGILFG